MLRQVLFPFFVLLMGFSGIYLSAQTDSIPGTKDKKKGLNKLNSIPTLSTRNSQKFDIIFNKGFLITNGKDKSEVPVNAAKSGTSTLALGFNIPFSHRYSVDLQPGVSFFRLYFDPSANRRFPTDSLVAYTHTKLRTSYLELPVCFRINLSYSEDKKPISFLQLGGSAGMNIGGSYKFNYKDANGDHYNLRATKVEGLEKFRYTAFGRIIYKKLGIFVSYRLTDVYKKNLSYGFMKSGVSSSVARVDNNSTLKFPTIAKFEFGLTIII